MLYQDAESLHIALEKYFRLNDFPPDGGAADKWARYKIGPFSLIAFPNFEHRMEALRRHDAHHIINDLDASNLGEGLIAAWELGSGCGKYWFSWFMESQALWFGIALAPRKTWSYFLRGRGSRNFFHEEFSSDLFDQSVGNLRLRLLLPSGPLNPRARDFVLFVGYAFLGMLSIAIFIPIVFLFTTYGRLFVRSNSLANRF